MAKNFSKKNPLDNLSGKSIPKSEEVQKETPLPAESKSEPVQGKSQTIQKRKVGRPKTRDIKNTCKNINVAVPITLLDKWEEIKIIHGNNLTQYITKLIEKDMNANYDRYKNIADSLKDI